MQGVESGVITSETVSMSRRWLVVGLCFIAFMLCNMDRVNMSIAILPMAEEFGWDSQLKGIVQSSFFWSNPPLASRVNFCVTGVTCSLKLQAASGLINLEGRESWVRLGSISMSRNRSF